MGQSRTTTESQTNESKKLRDLIKDVRIAMLTTVDAEGKLRSRPLATIEVDGQHEGDLLFFVRQESGKVDEIKKDNQVNVAYAEPGGNTYVSVSGAASVGRDPALAKKHWSPMLQAWFEGPEDPSLAVLTVRLEKAEYWDGPGSWVARAIALGKAALGDHDAKIGDHGTVRSN